MTSKRSRRRQQKAHKDARVVDVDDKKKIIDKLEGRYVRTRETYFFWAQVKDGKIPVVDIDLMRYSVRVLEVIARSFTRPRIPGYSQRNRRERSSLSRWTPRVT